MNARPNGKVMRPVWPNAGIRVAYRRKLLDLVDEMARSYWHWVRAAYRATPPRMAQDTTPAKQIQIELRRLGRRWQDRIDDTAPALAKWFLKSAADRSDAVLRKILRDSGVAVRFKVTPALRDVLEAKVAENVSLIRSIGEQFHTEIEGLVMRSVSTGRDLEQLSKDLRERFGVTRRRAEFIAIDQNNKATSAIQQARQIGLGLEEGVWLHSHAGKEPRPTHVANHGKRFDLRTGWYDPDPKVRRHIMPGWLINCRCTWKVVVKGFT